MTLQQGALYRYNIELLQMPASGGGGAHTSLLRVANFGRLAGCTPAQVSQDLAAHVHGTRKVSRKEIEAAVSKAFCWPAATHARNANVRPVVNGEKLFKAIVERGASFAEEDLWESSPVKIDWPLERDGIEILRRLYRPDERLFIGTRYDAGIEHVLPVSKWIRLFESGIAIPEHIIPNPLTGKRGHTKEGNLSYRADSCVATFRFAVVEFDTIPRELQILFWAGVPAPVVALVDSGGKSIHGWIRIDAVNADEWTQRVERKLFSLLTVVGADGACKNEARLSRTPGHFRADKTKWQRILYLNPVGGPGVRQQER